MRNFVNRLFDRFEELIEPFPPADDVAPPDRALAFIRHYSRGMWPWLLTLTILTAVIAILEIWLFGFLANIVNWFGERDPGTFLMEERGSLLVMALVILIAIPVTTFLHIVLMHQTIYGNYPMAIRWRAHNFLLGQSFSFFQDEFAGRIATKLLQTSLAVRETVMKVLDVLVYTGVYFFGALVLVASFDFTLLFPFLLWFCGYVWLLRKYLPRLRDVSRMQADARSEMTGRIVDSYTNIQTVKLFAHAGHEVFYAKDGMRKFLKTVHPQMRNVSELNIILTTINALLLFGVGAVGVALWVRGGVSVGGVAVALGLVLRLQGMAQWIMWEMGLLFENLGVLYDGMSMLSKKRGVQDEKDAQELHVSAGAVEFDQVSFNYGRDIGVIDNLSLKIAPGEKIGLVGRSGAGKTTLTNLLLRLYDIEQGEVRVDGKSIKSITQESLRRQIGVVTQDTSLLHRSVYDNIAYGRPDATEDAVVAAAVRANALEFIETLEDPKGRTGFEAHVGERGIKLSGGQRQRIAIARMFLKDAPILLLDEATSALDSEVEAAIQENLDELMAGKTVIAIAHRLSTIAAMDRLIVMQNGSVIEEGSHESLVKSDGVYSSLWSRQSGGFLPSNDEESELKPVTG